MTNHQIICFCEKNAGKKAKQKHMNLNMLYLLFLLYKLFWLLVSMAGVPDITLGSRVEGRIWMAA